MLLKGCVDLSRKGKAEKSQHGGGEGTWGLLGRGPMPVFSSLPKTGPWPLRSESRILNCDMEAMTLPPRVARKAQGMRAQNSSEPGHSASPV